MTDVPDEVERLGRERQEARQRKEFERADALRDQIRELGFDVVDAHDGWQIVVRGQRIPRVAPADVAASLQLPPIVDISVHWLVQAWPQDIDRGLAAVQAYPADTAVQQVVVDVSDGDPGRWLADADAVVALDRDPGWATAVNAGLRTSRARTIVVVDGSIEPSGDILGPIEQALEDPSVGLVGPFGIVTEDLREFHVSDGPNVDAIEGYLMAFRREVFLATGGFDEKFKFYRTADIEFSFRVKDLGLRTCVIPLPVVRHEHRMWAATPAERRDALSKRNFYRFLDRWRGRMDLTESGKTDRGAEPG